MKKNLYHRGTEDTEKKQYNNHGFSRMSADQIFVFSLRVLRASVVNRFSLTLLSF